MTIELFMLITAQNTLVQSSHHSISCLAKKPRLPMYIILQTQYLKTWNEVTEDAYATAIQNSMQEGT